MSTINQKEYLKKYLSKGNESDKKKKRKKKGSGVSDRVKIIDDDIDMVTFNKAVEEDLYAMNEDAPQIVGIIDERPLELRIDDYRKSDKWKPLGLQAAEERIDMKEDHTSSSSKEEKHRQTDERKQILNRLSERDIDVTRDFSPPRRKRRSSDASPPRKIVKNEFLHNENEIDADYSPPRKNRRDSDYSPSRRNRRDSDRSTTKRREKDSGSHRRNRRNSDSSPARNQSRKYNANLQDKNKKSSNHAHTNIEDTRPNSISRKNKSRWNSSPLRENIKKEPDSPNKQEEINQLKMKKTLDGKMAGLQDANELVKETQVLKERENEIFKHMPAEVSGKNAATIIRDRKTGKIRDFDKEAEDEMKKKEKEDEHKEKYDKWGRGLKQVEEYNEKLASELQEMNKPFARYADDEDLERHLKEQEREGDPMLAYIRKKKRKEAVITGKKVKPEYEGEFMPNRYGIKPGFRWDGVNRSNGYEKKWFEVLNSRRAQQEEVYKWSTEDM